MKHEVKVILSLLICWMDLAGWGFISEISLIFHFSPREKLSNLEAELGFLMQQEKQIENVVFELPVFLTYDHFFYEWIYVCIDVII